jgi:glycosyltransferase A (GT-A) superfamily protein (DUF2064 family)
VTVLLVVAKAPVPGQVKTRLTPRVTPTQAAALAAAALLDTLEVVYQIAAGHGDLRPVVALAGDLDEAVSSVKLRRALVDARVIAQRGSGFADRLVNAHADATEPGEPVVQIGMDTPQVTADLLGAAITSISAGRDATIGPAADGGWWLLGLRDARHAECLATVTMSTDRTGADTEAALRRRGLRLSRQPELVDVDTCDDAMVVCQEAPHTRFAALVEALLGRGPN